MNRPDPVTREISPCKDCVDKHTACHDKCKKYKSWKRDLDELNKRRKEYENKPFVRYNPFDY